MSDAASAPEPAKRRDFPSLRSNLRRLYTLLCVLFFRGDALTLAIGAAVMLLGRAVHVWAHGHLRKVKPRQDGSLPRIEPTTSGPYAFVRHPLYVGAFLSDLGIGLMAWNPWVFAPYMIGISAVMAVRTVGEELIVAANATERWPLYAAAVPRLIPRPWPWAGRQRRAMSWKLVAQNREWSRSLGVLAIACILFGVWHWQIDVLSWSARPIDASRDLWVGVTAAALVLAAAIATVSEGRFTRGLEKLQLAEDRHVNVQQRGIANVSAAADSHRAAEGAE